MDFGELWVRLAGVMTKCYLFVFRMSYSGKAVHQVFATCGQEAFLEGHALLSNCVIFHTTSELMEVIRQLQAEGWSIDPADLAEISPYITEPIRRFGEYSTDELDLRPDAFDPNLDVDFDTLTDPGPRQPNRSRCGTGLGSLTIREHRRTCHEPPVPGGGAHESRGGAAARLGVVVDSRPGGGPTVPGECVHRLRGIQLVCAGRPRALPGGRPGRGQPGGCGGRGAGERLGPDHDHGLRRQPRSTTCAPRSWTCSTCPKSCAATWSLPNPPTTTVSTQTSAA